jgi:hypothetical protein
MTLSIYKTIGASKALNGISYRERTGSRVSIDKRSENENGFVLNSVKDFITFANIFHGRGKDHGMEIKTGINLGIFSSDKFDYGIFNITTDETLCRKEEFEIFEAGVHLLDQPSKQDKRTWGRFKYKQRPTKSTNVWELDRLLNLGQDETSYFVDILINTNILDRIFNQLNKPTLSPYTDDNLGKRTPLRNFLRNDDVTVPEYKHTKLTFYKASKSSLEYAKNMNFIPGHFLLSPNEFSGKISDNKVTMFSTIEENPVIENYEFYLSWHESNIADFISPDPNNTILELRFRSATGLSHQVFYIKNLD